MFHTQLSFCGNNRSTQRPCEQADAGRGVVRTPGPRSVSVCPSTWGQPPAPQMLTGHMVSGSSLSSGYLGTLVWKRLLTGIRPLLSSSMPTESRPRFWVKGRLPIQTSSTSHVKVSFFPPAAASTLKHANRHSSKQLVSPQTQTGSWRTVGGDSRSAGLTPRRSCHQASWWPPELWYRA